MRFDLLLMNKRGYTYESHASKRVIEASQKSGIRYKKICFSEDSFQDYMRFVEEDPPSFMLSFSPLLPFETPLCDLIGIPQGVWVESSLAEAAHFLTSQQGRLFLPSETTLDRAHYLAHGVERGLSKEPIFDLVFFASLVDLECLKEQWEECFTPSQIQELEHGIQKEVFNEVLFSQKSHAGHLLATFEEYLKAKRGYQVIASSRVPIHVFGQHIGNNWYRRLPNADLVHLHAPIPYTERFKVWSLSRIALLDPLNEAWSAQIAATGCLPLRIDAEDLEEQIEAFLADTKKREKALESYQERIESLSWENQTAQLLKYFL